jgi:putative ubiquitin-RnfH superfamily antitoxin RatB of RatAB toxin-antitoxin module
MLVKVARLGTAVQELALTDGATVNAALESADLSVENEDIRVNNGSASVTTVLKDGDIVTLVPKVKGGQRIVKVARLGTAVQEVAVAEDASVNDALAAAGIDIDNEDVRLDGHSADINSQIGSGNLITIVPKVKGGK